MSEGNTELNGVFEKRKEVTGKILWSGDLEDDCTAEWQGLLLRAEWMDDNDWWWEVSDLRQGLITIDNSNEYDVDVTDGEMARAKAEAVAKAYLEAGTQR